MEESVDQKREKLASFVKKGSSAWVYLVLAFVVWFSVFIRTRNLGLLKDKFGVYLPLALDPHLYYRYAHYILENGRIFAVDTARYVPLGLSMTRESPLLPYIIVYLYKIFHVVTPSISLAFVDVIYPVVFFVLSLIVFYFLGRRFFDAPIALLATAFLAVIPTFLYRTMAGFSDKESLATFFMFCSFYFFVRGWQSKKIKKVILFGLLSGIMTGLMGLVWGGAKFVLIIIAGFALIEFFLNKFHKKDFYLYVSWLIPVVILLSFFTGGYGGFTGIITSFSSGLMIVAFVLFFLHFLFSNKKWFKNKIQTKMPRRIWSLIVTIIIILLAVLIIFGPAFFAQQVGEVSSGLLHPVGTNRFAVTVAENNQPYFSDWWANYSWFFYFFFLGSVLLFYKLVAPLGKKYKLKFTIAYFIFIFFFIFSRYSAGAVLNGVSGLSRFLYLGSLIGFALFIVIYYLYMFYKDRESFARIKQLDKNFIFIFVWFVLMIVAARGAMRLFFMFSPIICILASYFFVRVYKMIMKFKENSYKILAVVILLLLFFAPFVAGSWTSFAVNSYNSAKYTGRSYNNQWEDGMEWVRGNTPEDAVFAHWWDYGYWVQTGGERATILDGGNKIVWWDHFMGRHVLTAQTEEEALEFLITHEATHLLLDPTDIGKYTAYSSIGSDESYDRVSYIPLFNLDNSQVQETREGTIYLYQGQFGLDEDFLYEDRLFPAGQSAIGGFFLPVKEEGGQISISQPTALLFYNNQRFDIPLNCVYLGNQKHYFDPNGLKGCLRLIPAINSEGTVEHIAIAGFYVSERVSRTLFADLYLFGGSESPHFKQVYADWPLGIFSGRFIGPLAIWEIDYPSGLEPNPEYLEEEIPDWFKGV